ncbi:MAG TPA: IPT/TIG domain-containing protein [Anaeromyxobacteraceae bacterium]|nr:IPT/TIG domain-containing protein [Anaeromyxobacteraceae bacterium]
MRPYAIAIGLALAGTAAFARGGRTGGQPPPPEVETVEPASGSSDGGTPITVTGSFFRAGAVVTLGNVDATDVVVLSMYKLTAVTRPHPPGAVSVSVTNRDGRLGRPGPKFTYVSPAEQKAR